MHIHNMSGQALTASHRWSLQNTQHSCFYKSNYLTNFFQKFWSQASQYNTRKNMINEVWFFLHFSITDVVQMRDSFIFFFCYQHLEPWRAIIVIINKHFDTFCASVCWPPACSGFSRSPSYSSVKMKPVSLILSLRRTEAAGKETGSLWDPQTTSLTV